MRGFRLGIKTFPLKGRLRYFDIGVDQKYRELWLALWFFVIIFYDKSKIE